MNDYKSYSKNRTDKFSAVSPNRTNILKSTNNTNQINDNNIGDNNNNTNIN